MGVANQPRAQGIDDVFDRELAYLIAKAWSVAERLKGICPDNVDRGQFVRTLVDCAFEMGGNAEDAASVFKAAMAVGIADDAARKRGA
jgi:hypothetical protein